MSWSTSNKNLSSSDMTIVGIDADSPVQKKFRNQNRRSERERGGPHSETSLTGVGLRDLVPFRLEARHQSGETGKGREAHPDLKGNQGKNKKKSNRVRKGNKTEPGQSKEREGGGNQMWRATVFTQYRWGWTTRGKGGPRADKRKNRLERKTSKGRKGV